MTASITAPPELPIADHWDELARLITDHQVVVVAGETGSGKSTQLPKLCLAIGRGSDGWIGHTQPRRIAARSVAERVAQELGCELGDTVGYAVRFNDRVSERTAIKLMTDGILLAEIQRDRLLRRYDTIIIDEAHERSLNIDFLLGYLKRLLPERPDLKVIITSATIDTERFSRHFDDAPIVEVSGRTYPVEIRYRPLDDEEGGESLDQIQGICRAVRELTDEAPGDILVFLSGEREIRDTADALVELKLHRTEVVPLFARLSLAEQHRVFAPHSGRRIVLATNVAETSLTVPGIRAVVDPGTARISRFNLRTKVQRLPIEDISQASANQRAGRCGRIGPGVCIRLYSEEDFRSRVEYTDPEIQRTNLASVILQMANLGLGEVEAFPFVDPPDARHIRDGIALLEELGALDPERRGRRGWLTPVGRRLARLPIDPRLGRMVLEAAESDCLAEVVVITAGLSIQDPRERPAERIAQANEAHNRFKDPDSDFLSYVHLWEYLHGERRARSSSAFRRMCRAEYLNYLRLREWQDLVTQLKRVTKELKLPVNRAPAPPEAIHRALLSGLLSHVGHYDVRRREYAGARNARWAIARGSALQRKSPKWAMAAELVETNRLWGRVIAPVRLEWLEEAGAHLLTRTFGDVFWDVDRGAAVTDERVSLYGMILVPARRINVATVDPVVARRLLIHHALVRGEWHGRHGFVATNRERIAEVEALEARARRRDLLASREVIEAFFDERVPEHVTSVGRFDRWWRAEGKRRPDLLDLPYEVLIRPAAGFDPEQYPDTWTDGDLRLELDYDFEPGAATDGLIVRIPIEVLNRVEAAPFDWLVPGYRRELVEALVRGLPKEQRKQLLPIADTVDGVLARVEPAQGPLGEVVGRELGRRVGEPVRVDPAALPVHLRPTFLVIGRDDTVLAGGTDLVEVKRRLEDEARRAIAGKRHRLERDGLVDWTLGDLPEVTERTARGQRILGYPALVDAGDSVAVRLLATPEEQLESHWAGTRRLLRLTLPNPAGHLARGLARDEQLALLMSPIDGVDGWVDDLITAGADHLLGEAGGPVRSEEDWRRLQSTVRERWARTMLGLGEAAAPALGALGRIQSRLGELADLEPLAPAVADARGVMHRLVFPGCLAAMGAERVPDLARYLTGLEWRLGRLPEHHRRDREQFLRCRRLEAEFDAVMETVPWSRELEEAQWLLEEFRVQTFAQHLGTRIPVSEHRVRNAIERLNHVPR